MPAMSRSGLGPNYRKLWTAHAVSNLGDGIRDTALPLLAAALTRDPALVAGVALAMRLSWAVFALTAGALWTAWTAAGPWWRRTPSAWS